jgi:hypothetical protein
MLIMALSDVKVRSAKPEAKAYKLTDGDGMVLLVHPNGSKYCRLPYRFGGKEKMLSLEKILFASISVKYQIFCILSFHFLVNVKCKIMWDTYKVNIWNIKILW